MLQEIRIKSLGVIAESTVEFAPGFNVITGETGAGKTMLLTALSLVLGGKADAQLVRAGADRAAAAASFTPTSEAGALLLSMDIEEDESAIILGRSLNPDGRSKGVLNGAPATGAQLAQVGAHLISIHAQNSNGALRRATTQRDLLDAYGGEEHLQLLEHVGMCFAKAHRAMEDLAIFETEVQAADAQRNELQELVEKVGPLDLKIGEIDSIKSDRERLGHLDLLRELASAIVTSLESIAGEHLGLAERNFDQLQRVDSTAMDLSKRFASLVIELSDIESETRRYLTKLDADPTELSRIETRFAAVSAILKRFNAQDESDLLSEFTSARAALLAYEDSESTRVTLRAAAAKAESEFFEGAERLSAARKGIALRLSTAVTTEIRELALPHSTFHVEITTDSSIPFEKAHAFGVDEIEFRFTAHTGGALLPIVKAASGGELSRLMLAIEVVLASIDPVPTYVFDEVDAGVGGSAAIEVGRRLAMLGKHSQVIVVTHLPQVAAWADHHVVITKESAGVTVSNVAVLDDSARVVEIARMLGGISESENAQAHAQELLALRATLERPTKGASKKKPAATPSA
ncbi:MAG: DNA repair protein RecN [Actinobacteria bacterium]|uniref:DNA repair protein RecN n=1 Tax=freshwater metagenome TaxID=449393 RepID=A0A6J6PDZ1_9ZZZZ|nr:DNA repair protein RecN [Actinomycetota bacterium]